MNGDGKISVYQISDFILIFFINAVGTYSIWRYETFHLTLSILFTISNNHKQCKWISNRHNQIQNWIVNVKYVNKILIKISIIYMSICLSTE